MSLPFNLAFSGISSGLQTKNASSVVPIFEDNFSSSTGWTLGTGQSIGSGVFTMNGGTSNVSYKSLGLTLSNTLWTLELDYKAISESGAAAAMAFSLTDSSNTEPTSCDMIGLRDDTNTSNQVGVSRNGGSSDGETGTLSTSNNVQYYPRLVRQSSTTMLLQFWLNSERTSQQDVTRTATISSAVVGLNRIVFGGWQSGTANRTYDNVAIYGVDRSL